MSNPKPLPSIEDIKATLSYDPETGIFTRLAKACGPSCKVGDVAGRVIDSGYRVISIKNKRYRAHRLAWLVFYGEEPDGFVDHINQNKDDNRICNLRLATKSENMRNRPAQKNNKLGVKGVHWDKRGKRFVAQIRTSCGKSRFLGGFHTIEEASRAYQNAAKIHHGKFVDGGN